MGGAVGLMLYSSDERGLREASGEVEQLAKRARTIAILNQTSYALEFREGIVRLLPLAQAGLSGAAQPNRRFVFASDPVPKSDENREYKFPEGMQLAIRRWNTDDWLTTAKNSVQVWRFDPDGLCEPISVRLNYHESWAIDTFHPLTATISDSQLEAR